MTRIPYPEPEEISEEYIEYILPDHVKNRSEGDESTEPMSVEQALKKARNAHKVGCHNLTLLKSGRQYATDVWASCGLNPRQRELVILSIARKFESEYEWQSHVYIALTHSILTRADILSISDKDWEGFEDENVLLLEFIDKYTDTDVDDELFGLIAEVFDPYTIVGTMHLASFYLGLYYILEAVDITLEGDGQLALEHWAENYDENGEEFVGWNLENLSGTHD